MNVNKIIRSYFLYCLVFFSISACNKDVEQLSIVGAIPPTGNTLEQILKNNPHDSLYYRLIVKSGQLSLLSSSDTRYTIFVTNNDSIKSFVSNYVFEHYGDQISPNASDSIYAQAIINYVSQEDAAKIVLYNVIPQSVTSADMSAVFPNYFYPSAYNPIPTFSSFLRLTIFPSSRNGYWLNNIPMMSNDVFASNGVIHHTDNLVLPPNQYIWDRINTDTSLAFLKAAINRADSGTVAPGFLKSALLNIGANLTIFAPTNQAFRTALTNAIGQFFISNDTSGSATPDAWFAFASALSSSPSIFSNPNLFSVLSASRIKGILVYHVFGSRAFTNNFPTDTTYYQTLLNTDTAYTTHPGIQIKAIFGNKYVQSATIKGVGNATPANVIINQRPLMPLLIGTNDQNYLNGVIHKIDQVLLPASL